MARHPGGRPLKFQDLTELQRKIDSYFEHCDSLQKPYLITGLALALDCDRDTLLNYEDKDEFFGTAIKNAKLKCHSYAEDYLYTGKNVTGAIFNLKNNYGWKDKYEADVTSGGETINPDPVQAAAYAEFLKGEE